MAQRMCKRQVLINFYSQFYVEIEWVKHFTTLEACRLDSQCHTFPKWPTNIWANVRELEERLNPTCGKMRIQPTTLNQIAFGHFLSQSFHKSFICQLKA
jgi:hypothetical protein